MRIERWRGGGLKCELLGLCLLLAVCLWPDAARSNPRQVEVQVTGVKDTRNSPKTGAGLEVGLKIARDPTVKEAVAFRIVPDQCRDDTGRDLLGEHYALPDFQSVERGWQASVKMQNPERQAATIKELKGEIQFFLPKNDRAATVTVDSFRSQLGQQIHTALLDSLAIEVTPWTRERYRVEQEKKKVEAARGPDASPPPVSSDPRIRKPEDLLAQIFGNQPNGSSKMDPNDIVVAVRDLGQHIAGFEFRDAANNKIPAQVAGMGYEPAARTVTYHFSNQLGETATKLAIYVATPNSVVKVPFTLSEINLP